ncbi:efflux RND transporter periplasmic adaptor subunit, partial [Sphingomonas bacterium]|uniref:efflux RND transporter periplasmic adaptor subunit n=1 Tax=Sphingomonas bacterium TaxID=1895847 RepID=UPI00157747F5
GQVVGAASGTLFRIAAEGELEMRAALAESDLAGLHTGARATVTPVGSQQGFAGAVWQVSPVVDPATRQGLARIALHYDPALRPGGFASVRIVAGGSVVPRLPESAVQTDEKGSYVYVLDRGDTVVRRAVTLGPVTDGGISIASGLAGDERVVVSAAAFLNPGQKVVPVRAAPSQMTS